MGWKSTSSWNLKKQRCSYMESCIPGASGIDMSYARKVRFTCFQGKRLVWWAKEEHIDEGRVCQLILTLAL